MRLKNLLLIVFLVNAATMFAQQADQDDDDKADKIEALKVGFITEKLNLSSAEAKNFWPVYNEYESQMKKLRLKEKENTAIIKAKTSATDADADKFLADQLSIKQQQLDLTKKYVAEFKKVLPPKKVARLFMLEQEFKQQLLKRLKERRGNK
jgi:adenylate kinase family enzyme